MNDKFVKIYQSNDCYAGFENFSIIEINEDYKKDDFQEELLHDYYESNIGSLAYLSRLGVILDELIAMQKIVEKHMKELIFKNMVDLVLPDALTKLERISDLISKDKCKSLANDISTLSTRIENAYDKYIEDFIKDESNMELLKTINDKSIEVVTEFVERINSIRKKLSQESKKDTNLYKETEIFVEGVRIDDVKYIEYQYLVDNMKCDDVEQYVKGLALQNFNLQIHSKEDIETLKKYVRENAYSSIGNWLSMQITEIRYKKARGYKVVNYLIKTKKNEEYNSLDLTNEFIDLCINKQGILYRVEENLEDRKISQSPLFTLNEELLKEGVKGFVSPYASPVETIKFRAYTHKCDDKYKSLILGILREKNSASRKL